MQSCGLGAIGWSRSVRMWPRCSRRERTVSATQTMGFALAPVEHQVELGVARLRGAGAVVLRYPAPRVREVASELLAWTTSGGGPT